jgi:hypothetical protein
VVCAAIKTAMRFDANKNAKCDDTGEETGDGTGDESCKVEIVSCAEVKKSGVKNFYFSFLDFLILNF